MKTVISKCLVSNNLENLGEIVTKFLTLSIYGLRGTFPLCISIVI
jgi:hypothetical protein